LELHHAQPNWSAHVPGVTTLVHSVTVTQRLDVGDHLQPRPEKSQLEIVSWLQLVGMGTQSSNGSHLQPLERLHCDRDRPPHDAGAGACVHGACEGLRDGE